jgi:hypothetical protein
MGSYPSGQRGLTVNQLADAFRGSNPLLPTFPEFFRAARSIALIAQMVEHSLGKTGVMGSNPIEGSIADQIFFGVLFLEERKIWQSRNTPVTNPI